MVSFVASFIHLELYEPSLFNLNVFKALIKTDDVGAQIKDRRTAVSKKGK